MPFVPFTSVLPQLVNVVPKLLTISSDVQHEPLPDHDQPM